MKRLFNYTILWAMSILLLILGCSDDGVTPQEPRESQISFDLSVFPDIGSTETPFQIVPLNFSDESGFVAFKFRYDFDSDGTFDTDWVNNDTLIHIYETPGKKTIKVEFEDHRGEYKKYEYSVFVGELELVPGLDPQKNHNEPNFAKDGTNRIVFALWENNHQLFIADLDAKSVTQLTEHDGSEGNNCKHVPDWSPDGSTILVDYKDATYSVSVETGELLQVSSIRPSYIEYSPDGKQAIILAGWSEVGTYILNLEENTSRVFSEKYNGVAWSQDGTQIAEFDYKNNKVSILNSNDGSLIRSYDVEYTSSNHSRRSYLDWSKDGKWINLCGINSLLNTETGNVYKVYAGNFNRTDWAECSMNQEGTKLAFTIRKADEPVDQIYILNIPDELN